MTRTIFVTTDNEWYPVINAHGSRREYEYGAALDLEDDEAEFILNAFANFHKAQDILDQKIREGALRPAKDEDDEMD